MWLVEGIRSLNASISQTLAADVTNAEPEGRGVGGEGKSPLATATVPPAQHQGGATIARDGPKPEA